MTIDYDNTIFEDSKTPNSEMLTSGRMKSLIKFSKFDRGVDGYLLLEWHIDADRVYKSLGIGLVFFNIVRLDRCPEVPKL